MIANDELREYLKMERVPKFTDDYIDEWSSDSNDIEGLHKIIDAFADEIVDLIAIANNQLIDSLLAKAQTVNVDRGVHGYSTIEVVLAKDVRTILMNRKNGDAQKD